MFKPIVIHNFKHFRKRKLIRKIIIILKTPQNKSKKKPKSLLLTWIAKFP